MWVQFPFQGTLFEFINQFTVMRVQSIEVEYTGLKFTEGVFNPKPKALEEGGDGLRNLYLQILSNIKNGTRSNDIEK